MGEYDTLCNKVSVGEHESIWYIAKKVSLWECMKHCQQGLSMLEYDTMYNILSVGEYDTLPNKSLCGRAW